MCQALLLGVVMVVVVVVGDDVLGILDVVVGLWFLVLSFVVILVIVIVLGSR